MNPYPSDPPLGSSGEDRRDRVFGPSEAYVSRSEAPHRIHPTSGTVGGSAANRVLEA
jgi:hypothetical protein